MGKLVNSHFKQRPSMPVRVFAGVVSPPAQLGRILNNSLPETLKVAKRPGLRETLMWPVKGSSTDLSY